MAKNPESKDDSNVIPFPKSEKSRAELIAEADASLASAHLALFDAKRSVIDGLIASGDLEEAMVFENGNGFDILYEGKKISSLEYIQILRQKCKANIKSYPATVPRWTEFKKGSES